jgi:hypothetical protein
MINYFKNPKHAQHMLRMHPMTLFIMMDMLLYISASGHEAIVTSMIRTPHEDRKLGAKSTVHQGGRAFDLRSKDWTTEFEKEFETHFENKYKGYGAISIKTLTENLVEVHGEGENRHAHIQLAPTYGDPLAWMKI